MIDPAAFGPPASFQEFVTGGALGLLKAQPGEMLFRWKTKDGAACGLRADDIDAALRQRAAETASGKNFRTFRGSSIVAGALQDAAKEDEKVRLDVHKST